MKRLCPNKNKRERESESEPRRRAYRKKVRDENPAEAKVITQGATRVPLRQRQRDVRRDLAASEPPIAFTKDQHGIGLVIPRLRAVLPRTGIPVISISEKEKLKNHKVFV